jgi:glycine betaine/proline transport system ATP-binding protein
VNIDKHGPRVALERMREEGISSIFAVDSSRNLKGYITADDASEARKNQVNDLKEILRNEVPTVERETPMHEIFNIIYDTPVPVAVTENGKLVGIIVRGAVIAALANDSEVNLNV